MRLSRGRSTPTRRAMNGVPSRKSRWSDRVASPASQRELRPSVPKVVDRPGTAERSRGGCVQLWITARASALALLVTRVLADHHDAAVATNHLALVTDRLDARVDLHAQ